NGAALFGFAAAPAALGCGEGAAPAAVPAAAVAPVAAAASSAPAAFVSSPATVGLSLLDLLNRLAMPAPSAARMPTIQAMNPPPPASRTADPAARRRALNPVSPRAARHPVDMRRPVLSSAQSRAFAAPRRIR